MTEKKEIIRYKDLSTPLKVIIVAMWIILGLNLIMFLVEVAINVLIGI